MTCAVYSDQSLCTNAEYVKIVSFSNARFMQVLRPAVSQKNSNPWPDYLIYLLPFFPSQLSRVTEVVQNYNDSRDYSYNRKK